MLVRKTSAKDGGIDYLEDGHKAGRDYNRDELDKRIQVDGDLNTLNSAIKISQKTKDWNSNFQHLSFGFTERDYEKIKADPDIAKRLTRNYLDFYYGHHKVINPETGELDYPFAYSAEIHEPKLKRIKNAKGELEDRLPHMHLLVSDLNMETDTKLEPALHSNKAMQAMQSFQCELFGFVDPRDYLREYSYTKADLIERWRTTIEDGPELHKQILSELIEENFLRTRSSENPVREFQKSLRDMAVNKLDHDKENNTMTLSFNHKRLGVDKPIEPIKVNMHKTEGKYSHLTFDGHKSGKIAAVRASRFAAMVSETEHRGLSEAQSLALFNTSRVRPWQALSTHFRREFSDLLVNARTREDAEKVLDKLPCDYRLVETTKNTYYKVTINPSDLGIPGEKFNLSIKGKGFENLSAAYYPDQPERHEKPKQTNEEIALDYMRRVKESYDKKNKDRMHRNAEREHLKQIKSDWYRSRSGTAKRLYYLYDKNFFSTEIQDFKTFSKDHEHHIYCESDGVHVVDKGDRLVVSTPGYESMAMSKSIQIALQVADSKGFELDDLNIGGNKIFKAEVLKQFEILKQRKAAGELYETAPGQSRDSKPKKTRKTKKSRSEPPKARRFDSVANSRRKDVLDSRFAKQSTNEMEYFKTNIKPQAVLKYMQDSKKIQMDISKFEVNGNRIRPAGTTYEGKSLVDFLMRDGSMSLKEAVASLDSISKLDENLINKDLPRPAKAEAKAPPTRTSSTYQQQEKENKPGQLVKAEQPAPQKPAAPAKPIQPSQPIKPVNQAPEDLSFMPSSGPQNLRNLELEEKNDIAQRVLRLYEIPPVIYMQRISQLGGKSRYSADELHKRLRAGDTSLGMRDIRQLENLTRGVDMSNDRTYPPTWHQYERDLFKSGEPVKGLKNVDGKELTSEDQKVVLKRINQEYIDNSSLKPKR